MLGDNARSQDAGKLTTQVFGAVLLLFVNIATAQINVPPVVSNVTASQIPGTYQVEVRYLLVDPEGAACSVKLEVSDNDGATWTVPASQVSGDVGSGVRPGAGKRIVWNAGADLPNRFGFFRFRVTANDNNAPPGMAFIPAGEFMMGDSFNEGNTDELPVHAVYVDAFFMDRYEVTNQQYADALNWALVQGNLITVTNGLVHEYYGGTSFPFCDTTTNNPYGRITWNGNVFGVVAGKENHPMTDVSWYGSVAYANWRSGMEGRTPSYNTTTWVCNFAANGYRLPTEAEWEKAVRGGASSHRFPWSDTDTIQHARSNYYSSADFAYDTSPTRGYHPTFGVGNIPYTSPVGNFAPNGYSLYDMAGNVLEWANDWYGSSYYSASPYKNPQGPASGASRVIRGGGWDYFVDLARCADRYGIYPDSLPSDANTGYGFRLALDGE